MRDTKKVSIGSDEYKITPVPLEDFDLVWDSAIRLLAVGAKSAEGMLDKDVSEISLADVDLGALSIALSEVRDVLGWKFLYRELGPTLAKHCELISSERPRRLDAIWSEHWNERGPLALLQWVVEALKVNCSDFLDGLGVTSALAGSESPSTSPKDGAAR